MSSDVAKAMYPGLAKPERAEPQALRHAKAGVSASEAVYGKKEEPPLTFSRIKSPMTYENLLRVPGLKPLTKRS